MTKSNHTLSDHERLLHWRCRRGMRELDLILLPFFEQQYFALSEEDKTRFTQLLEETDQDLFNWLRGGETPENESIAMMVKRIRQSMNMDPA